MQLVVSLPDHQLAIELAESTKGTSAVGSTKLRQGC